MSVGTVHTIIREEPKMRKICAKLGTLLKAPRMWVCMVMILTNEQIIIIA